MPPLKARREPVQVEPEEVDAVDSTTEEEPDELAALLSGLAGGVDYYAAVFRQLPDGSEEFLPGRLPMKPGDDPEQVLDRVSTAHGAGHYRLQLRRMGQRGTVGNVHVRIGGRAALAGQASPAPDALTTLLTNQNRDLLGMMREVLTRPAPAPPPPGPAADLGKIMRDMGAVLGFSQRLQQQATTLPAWLEDLGQAAGPVLGLLARKLQPQPRPVPNTAASAPQPRPVNTSDQPAPTAAPDVLVQVLTAAAAQAAPDVETVAGIIVQVGGPDVPLVCESLGPGLLAARAIELVPALKDKGDFAQRLESRLRDLVKGASGA